MVADTDGDLFDSNLYSKFLSDANPKTPLTPSSLLASCLSTPSLGTQIYYQEARPCDEFRPSKDEFRPSKRVRYTLPTRDDNSEAVIRRVKVGGTRLTVVQWDNDDRLYFMISEVFRDLFASRARASLNLRSNFLKLSNTLVQHADYPLRMRLKKMGHVKLNTNCVKFIEFDDLLRLKVSLQFEPKMKRGICASTSHIDKVDTQVQIMTCNTITKEDKLQLLYRTF